MLTRLCTILLVLLAMGTGARAQSWEVGLGGGVMVYKGDIAPNFNFRDPRPAGNLIVRRNLSQPLTLRLNLGIGSIAGRDSSFSDPFQQARNTSFRSSLREVSMLFEYNFLNYSQLRRVKNWTPYLFGGVGVHSAGLQNSVERSPYRQIHFPLGVGIKYEFKRPWSLGLEFGTRFTTTDYLDSYGPETFSGTQKLRQGNPSDKDRYTFIGLSLTYTFYKIVCPE
ncbi:type IX secretion system protein PorG [Tellurirhabdus rosea]|uniref:type IX secretion system protein PorG n=1 Tax=Tellurirhabdus rosea TaxID=2674997 RepID=UPI0022563F46|nr:DUF6089 family protein [Tellurirhabdus rosea]